jgi:hypothetical protein
MPKPGAESLFHALDKHDDSILNNVSYINFNQVYQNDGNKILGHILGNKQDVLTQILGKQIGIPRTRSTSVLSMLAPLVMGFLGQQKNIRGLDMMGVATLTTTLMQGFSQEPEGQKEMGFVGKLFD